MCLFASGLLSQPKHSLLCAKTVSSQTKLCSTFTITKIKSTGHKTVLELYWAHYSFNPSILDCGYHPLMISIAKETAQKSNRSQCQKSEGHTVNAEPYDYFLVETLTHVQYNYRTVSCLVDLIFVIMKTEHSFVREDNIFTQSRLRFDRLNTLLLKRYTSFFILVIQ